VARVLTPRRKTQTDEFNCCMNALPPTETAMDWLVAGTMPELGGKEKRCRLKSLA
jgi:hypothetical protein